MREGEPGWFYVGNGQLRYKDGAGWTDRYEDIDGDATTSDVELGPVSGKSGRRRGGPALSPFTRRCAAAAYRMIAPGWRLIAAGYSEASASASRRAIARRPRHRGGRGQM